MTWLSGAFNKWEHDATWDLRVEKVQHFSTVLQFNFKKWIIMWLRKHVFYFVESYLSSMVNKSSRLYVYDFKCNFCSIFLKGKKVSSEKIASTRILDCLKSKKKEKPSSYCETYNIIKGDQF